MFDLISCCSSKLFGSAETPFQELTTPDGTSVWAGDGVHLTSPAYRVAARLLTAELERAEHGETGEPVTKRTRLESVVPTPAPPPARQAIKPPPPTPKPVAPPLWLSGQLPPTQKNNRDGGYGRDFGGVRGGGGQGGRGGGGRGRGRGKNENHVERNQKIVILRQTVAISGFLTML